MKPDYKARKRGEPTMLLRDRLYGKTRVNPKTPYAMLADKYGVCKKTMMNAIKGKNWKCVKYFPETPKEEKKDD